MEVTILTTSFPSYDGDSKAPFIADLAKAIRKKNVEVNIVAPLYAEGSKYEINDGVKVYRFDYPFLPFFTKITSSESIAQSIKTISGMLQLPLFILSFIIKSRKPIKNSDLVHCQWILPSIVAYFYNIFYKKPFIITSRGEELELIKKSKLKNFIFRIIARRCSYMTSNNSYQAEGLLHFFKKNRVAVIPNGVDTVRFRAIDKKKAREICKIPNDKFIVLFIGWIIKRKGVDYLVKAIEKILVKNNNFFFVIIGMGSMKDVLVDYVEKNNLSENVMFISSVKQDKVPHFMSASDLFILPSLAEGRPNVVLEALSCGIPVIATDIGGNNELVKNNYNGILIKTKSSQDIVNAVNLLFNNKKLYKFLKNNSRKSILSSDLTWNNCASKFINIYRGILDDKT